MASVNLRGIGTQTLSLFLCYFIACDLTPLAAPKAQAGREEGPGCCHSPLPWIWSCGFSYLLRHLETEGLLPGCHVQVKSRFVTSEEREEISRTASSLPHIYSFGDLGEWEWSKLCIQFLYHSSFSH